jgi:hypothetical protein
LSQTRTSMSAGLFIALVILFLCGITFMLWVFSKNR